MRQMVEASIIVVAWRSPGTDRYRATCEHLACISHLFYQAEDQARAVITVRNPIYTFR